MTDPKRISSGLSLPVWMRRTDNRYDAEGSFSPPTHDESFFYIRYPVSGKQNDNTATELNKLHSALQNSDSIVKSTPMVTTLSATNTTSVDFTKHTEPCRKYIGDKISPSAANGINKSQGTDDGFGKACSNSILKVAQKIVSGRQFGGKGGVLAANFDEANVEPEDTLRDSEDNKMSFRARTMMRRGSKSLPASPAGSPKTQRKVTYNPYFTTYATVGANENRSWFLTSLLGVQRETVPSTSSTSIGSQIDEEAEDVYEPKNNSITSNNNNNNINNSDNLSKKPTNVLRAKPSELREMNFWSPTSM
jgi:hypothetical protein